MADLNIVVLSHNDLEDISPLRNCSRITELYVDNNLLTSMDAIEKMPLLQVLNCGHNQITVIPELPDMIYLKTFDAAYNLLTSIAPLAGLPELSTVNVDYNEQIEDIEILSSCPVLVQVNAFGTHVKEVGKLTDMSVIVNFDPSYADKADEAKDD
jgi:internalin A